MFNRSKFFGARPIFYFTEPAAVGSDGGSSDGSGASGSTASSSTGSSSSGGSSVETSIPQSDDQILELVSEKPSGAIPPEKAPATETEATETPEINLDALKDGQPEWLAKVTDAKAKAEIEKLIGFQKQFADWFKDDADRDAFLKDLPGGREQIAALQTLSREIAELDGNIAANTTETNALVASRYLSEAPDGGVGLARAGLLHIAKAQPEGYKQLGAEIANATLKASGIGADVLTVASAISNIRQILQNSGDTLTDEQQKAFGTELGKLIGTPKAETQQDSQVELLKTERETAQREVSSAKTEVWNINAERTASEAQNHMRQMIGQALAVKVNGKQLISDVISAESRGRLVDAIYGDVDSQLMADPWYVSQLRQLIGNPKEPLLTAKKEDFAKALEITKARVSKLLTASTIKKHVEAWARDVVAKNNSSLQRARGAAASGDKVGSAPAVGSGGKVRPLTQEALAKMSPEERDDAILAQLTRK